MEPSLLDLQSLVEDYRHRIRNMEASSWRSGTVFPKTPAIGETFRRTDLGFGCYFDGTRWLTLHEYEVVLSEWAVRAGGYNYNIPLRTDFLPYFTHGVFHSSVAAPNDGTRYWTINVNGGDLAFTGGTLLFQVSTASHTAGVVTNDEGVAYPNASPSAANKYWLNFNTAIAAGAPGALSVSAVVFYRLIIP